MKTPPTSRQLLASPLFIGGSCTGGVALTPPIHLPQLLLSFQGRGGRKLGWGLTGGHTGGVWEVFSWHLPCLQPFIHRPFRRFTGGGRCFCEMSYPEKVDSNKTNAVSMPRRCRFLGLETASSGPRGGIFLLERRHLFGDLNKSVGIFIGYDEMPA